MKIISFCITVYNQRELVKQCVESIIGYKGDDIEIVISDDHSTENIRELVDSFNDNRIKYCQTVQNEGHDRNILNALSSATGKYAFLLRTRDLVICEAIPLLIQAAEQSNAAYITGDAVNQQGKTKIKYAKNRYLMGRDALAAHYSLYTHPSGSMYRLANLDIDKIREFLDNEDVSKTGFIVHSLIRKYLAEKGDFYLIQHPVWVYTDTEESKDKAVNHAQEKKSVYDPVFIEQRFEYEVKWDKAIFTKDDLYFDYLQLCTFYLDQLTWGFKIINNDKRQRFHYDFEKRHFSVMEQRKRFWALCQDYYDEKMGVSSEVFTKDLKKIFRDNLTKGYPKYVIRAVSIKTPIYNYLAQQYHRYVKRL